MNVVGEKDPEWCGSTASATEYPELGDRSFLCWAEVGGGAWRFVSVGANESALFTLDQVWREG